jgi:hypothetical protein
MNAIRSSRYSTGDTIAEYAVECFAGGARRTQFRYLAMVEGMAAVKMGRGSRSVIFVSGFGNRR